MKRPDLRWQSALQQEAFVLFPGPMFLSLAFAYGAGGPEDCDEENHEETANGENSHDFRLLFRPDRATATGYRKRAI